VRRSIPAARLAVATASIWLCRSTRTRQQPGEQPIQPISGGASIRAQIARSASSSKASPYGIDASMAAFGRKTSFQTHIKSQYSAGEIATGVSVSSGAFSASSKKSLASENPIRIPLHRSVGTKATIGNSQPGGYAHIPRAAGHSSLDLTAGLASARAGRRLLGAA
jgi:hypothetical protein